MSSHFVSAFLFPNLTTLPAIYLTLQAYLRRAPSYLTFSLSDAKIHNYAFGVKLVRGAYLEGEIEAPSSQGSFKDAGRLAKSVSISPDRIPPVRSTKRETDEVYDECVRVSISGTKVMTGGNLVPPVFEAIHAYSMYSRYQPASSRSIAHKRSLSSN